MQKKQSKSQCSCKNFIFIEIEHKKRIVNSFRTSHFSYCPLVWMFHRQCLNNCVNHIHELFIKIINSPFKELLNHIQELFIKIINSPFKELLKKDSFLTIHQRNLKLIVTEMLKLKLVVPPISLRKSLK